MAGKYTGFDRLKSTLAKRPGVKDPAALSAAIGKKKYSAKRFNRAAAQGKKLGP
jgi:hypothetical protein